MASFDDNGSDDGDDTLLACVAMNPEPYAFAVRCAGVEPELTLSGPWSDGDGVTAA